MKRIEYFLRHSYWIDRTINSCFLGPFLDLKGAMKSFNTCKVVIVPSEENAKDYSTASSPTENIERKRSAKEAS